MSGPDDSSSSWGTRSGNGSRIKRARSAPNLDSPPAQQTHGDLKRQRTSAATLSPMSGSSPSAQSSKSALSSMDSSSPKAQSSKKGLSSPELLAKSMQLDNVGNSGNTDLGSDEDKPKIYKPKIYKPKPSKQKNTSNLDYDLFDVSSNTGVFDDDFSGFLDTSTTTTTTTTSSSSSNRKTAPPLSHVGSTSFYPDDDDSSSSESESDFDEKNPPYVPPSNSGRPRVDYSQSRNEVGKRQNMRRSDSNNHMLFDSAVEDGKVNTLDAEGKETVDIKPKNNKPRQQTKQPPLDHYPVQYAAIDMVYEQAVFTERDKARRGLQRTNSLDLHNAYKGAASDPSNLRLLTVEEHKRDGPSKKKHEFSELELGQARALFEKHLPETPSSNQQLQSWERPKSSIPLPSSSSAPPRRSQRNQKNTNTRRSISASSSNRTTSTSTSSTSNSNGKS